MQQRQLEAYRFLASIYSISIKDGELDRLNRRSSICERQYLWQRWAGRDLYYGR
jgi:hypothetical protein